MSPLLTGLPLLSGAEMLRAQYSLRLMSCSVAVRMSGTSGVICKMHKPDGGRAEHDMEQAECIQDWCESPGGICTSRVTGMHKAPVEPPGQKRLVPLMLKCYLPICKLEFDAQVVHDRTFPNANSPYRDHSGCIVDG